jgi:hypothetical protein
VSKKTVNKKSRSGKKRNPGWFSKGRSGNLGGRPKGSRASPASAIDIVVERKLTVPHLGGTREITMEEAIQQRTFRDAIAGKRMAMREVAKWIMKRLAWFAKHARSAQGTEYRPACAAETGWQLR